MQQSPDQRPNILLITTDQQRFDALACMGNPHIYTPHLDWLAHEGILFSNAYADCPSCIPSRATIMTGRHGFTQGLTTMGGDTNPLYENPTLPALLTAAGYQTRAQGKMHFIPTRANHGFESKELPIDYIRERARYTKTTPIKAHGLGENEYIPGIDTVPDDETLTHWTVLRSIDFIETRDDTRPFFLWTSFGKPHPPFAPTQSMWSLYAQKHIDAPHYGDWSQQHTDIPPSFMGPTKGLNNTWDADPSQIIDTKRAYYACVSQVDYALGVLFARMRELGLLENTWIIFTSDHGDMMGDHHMFGKGVFLEGSAHIPLIVRAPSPTWDRNKPFLAERNETIVTLADIMPTILSLAQVPIPEHVDGENLLNLHQQEDTKRTFYGNCANSSFAIIDDGYKYTLSTRGGDELLFHLRNDPHELINLAASNKHQDTKQRLQQKLLQKMDEHNCPAINNGAWIIREPTAEPSERFVWPGFHSTSVTSDVLH